jgi:hypothetical protein
VTPRRRSGIPNVVGLAILAALLTACAAAPASTPIPSVLSSPLAQVAPTASPSAPAGSAPVGSAPVGSPAVPIDPGLLAVLPATIGGQAVNEVPDVEDGLVTDPSLVQNAAALAVALGINLTTGDFAYVAVIRLKPLVFGNAFYLAWRQSYDEGACSQSSGVKGTSTATIAGQQVFIGTCAGGASTYHVHLTAPDRLISITSVGTAGYGTLVLAGLRP